MSASPSSDQSEPTTPKAGPSDDVKRKFREALEKKKAHAGTDVSDHSDRSKVDHGHGPETTARDQMFRRKSG